MKRWHLALGMFGLLMIGVAVLTFTMLRRLHEESRTLTLSAALPVWTASIEGVAGDTAEIWIWTSTATLRTNLAIPATLKLDRKSLLLTVRSRGNRDLMLHVVGPSNGSAHVPLKEGTTNAAVFLSRSRIPGTSVDSFMATTLGPGVPIEVMPVYSPFWSPPSINFVEVKQTSDTRSAAPSP
jgi:hypothetical protein